MSGPRRNPSMRTPTITTTTNRSSRTHSHSTLSEGRSTQDFDARTISDAGRLSSVGGSRGGRSAGARSGRGRRNSHESKHSGAHVKITEVRRGQLEAKKRLEHTNRRIAELKQAVEASDQTIGELTVATRNQAFQIKGEDQMLQKELADQTLQLDAHIEQEAVCDHELAKQEKELKELETAVDQIRLKFIYAFLTGKHSPGIDVDPIEIFRRRRRVSSLIGGHAHAPLCDLDASQYILPEIHKEKAPNIVTPFLAELMEELEVERRKDGGAGKGAVAVGEKDKGGNHLAVPTDETSEEEDAPDDGEAAQQQQTPLTPQPPGEGPASGTSPRPASAAGSARGSRGAADSQHSHSHNRLPREGSAHSHSGPQSQVQSHSGRQSQQSVNTLDSIDIAIPAPEESA